MKNIQPSTLLKKKYMFNILDTLKTEIEVTENPYLLPIEELFTMAARINKKRSFLFVSKILGKHLPIDPNKGLLTSALLAIRFADSVKGWKYEDEKELIASFNESRPYNSQSLIPDIVDPVVIGFAETATALGQAFFDCFQSAEFFHTTREELCNANPRVTFEEEHSHATSHRCYIPEEMIQNEREIILVDDEVTTGKTALNIIQSIQEQFPRKEYTVVSILDWRSEESKNKFLQMEQKFGIKINVVSLVAGDVKVTSLKELDEPITRTWRNQQESQKSTIEFIDISSYFTLTKFTTGIETENASFIEETGRFGLQSVRNPFQQDKLEAAAAYLKEKRKGRKTLCLGTGEFMYLPMKLAAGMGTGISYQSTTRSPIYIENREGYGAKYGVSFPSPENPTVPNYVYNIPPGYYDELFIFFEREVEKKNLRPLLKELKSLQIESIKVVFASINRGESNAKNKE